MHAWVNCFGSPTLHFCTPLKCLQFLNGIISSQGCSSIFKVWCLSSKYPHLCCAYPEGLRNAKVNDCILWVYLVRLWRDKVSGISEILLHPEAVDDETLVSIWLYRLNCQNIIKEECMNFQKFVEGKVEKISQPPKNRTLKMFCQIELFCRSTNFVACGTLHFIILRPIEVFFGVENWCLKF